MAVPPFAALQHDGVALIDAETARTIPYAELRDEVGRRATQLAAYPGLVCHLSSNSVESIQGYLGALASGNPVLLLDASLSVESLRTILECYRPDWITGDEPLPGVIDGATGHGWAHRASGPPGVVPHPDLCLVLPTSGSTGNPKAVRLSGHNVQSNADAIARSLSLTPKSRAITSLPLHYSYGLSVLHSHLTVGGSLVVGSRSVLERELWAQVDRFGVTSVAGVPYTYQMLRRLRFDPSRHPSLRQFTQAGGRLDPARIEYFAGVFTKAGIDFYVMYGQTEAAPRISCLPPSQILAKLGSVGVALEGGSFEAGAGADAPAEVVYTGPNVMMGYAQRRADLADGDIHGDTLRTGDLGFVDNEGFLFLTGRVRRIAKVFGNRVNLDDIERLADGLGHVAVVAHADALHLFHSCPDPDDARELRGRLAKQLKIPASAVVIHRLDELPTLSSGKSDYRTLTGMTQP